MGLPPSSSAHLCAVCLRQRPTPRSLTAASGTRCSTLGFVSLSLCFPYSVSLLKGGVGQGVWLIRAAAASHQGVRSRLRSQLDCKSSLLSISAKVKGKLREGKAYSWNFLCALQTAFSDFLSGSSKDLAKHIKVVVSTHIKANMKGT